MDCNPQLQYPPGAKWQFAGWIPTSAGRISFRRVGEATKPTVSLSATWVAIETNSPPKMRRFNVAFQQRHLSDSASPLFDILSGVSGRFWFGMAIEGGDPFGPNASEDFVEGNVWVISGLQRTAFFSDRKILVGGIHDLQGDLTQAERNERLRSFVEIMERWSIVTCRIRLFRTGEIYVDAPLTRAIDFAGNCIGGWTKPSGEDAYNLANQVYAFIRDVAHSHQHHTPSDDQMLVLFDLDGDDSIWRARVMHTLMNYIVQIKRKPDPVLLSQSKGVLAYAEAFREISRRSGSYGVVVDYDTTSLRQSIEANLAECEASQIENMAISENSNRKSSFFLGIYATFLAISAIIAEIFGNTWANLYRSSSYSGEAKAFLHFFINNFVFFLIFLFLLHFSSLAVYIFRNNYRLRARKNNFSTGAVFIPKILKRIIFVFPKKHYASIPYFVLPLLIVFTISILVAWVGWLR